MNIDKNRDRLLNGSIIKSLLMISLPIIFANILQTVYQLIDTFWVGRLGTGAVAAVSLSFPLLFFLTSFAMGLSMAGAILIAQYNGRGDREKVALITGQTFSIVLIIAILLSIIGYFSAEWLLSFLTNDSLVLEQATSYLKISFIAIVAMFIYNIFQSVFRGIGEVKVPMLIILGTVTLNFFLDPLFMFGWKFIPALGVSGVALATLVTESLAALIGIILLIKGNLGVKLKLAYLKLDFFWVKRIFKLGLPSSLEHSSRSLSMVLMIFLVSTFGTLVIASYGIGTRVLSFVIIPAIGFSIATSTMVGNNLGAKQHERAEKIVKSGLVIGFSTLLIIGTIMFIFAKTIASFFVPNEIELILMSARFIRIMALTFGFIGVQMVIFGSLKAAGKTTTTMLLAMAHSFMLFFFSFILAFTFNLNELGIWIAYPIANFLALLISIYYYRKKSWLKKELI